MKAVDGDIVRYETGSVRSSEVEDVRYDLIPPSSLRRLAQTYAEGAKKYGDNNWLKGQPYSDILNHLINHIERFREGDRSEDHLSHATWGMFALMHFEDNLPEMDNTYYRKCSGAIASKESDPAQKDEFVPSVGRLPNGQIDAVFLGKYAGYNLFIARVEWSKDRLLFVLDGESNEVVDWCSADYAACNKDDLPPEIEAAYKWAVYERMIDDGSSINETRDPIHKETGISGHHDKCTYLGSSNGEDLYLVSSGSTNSIAVVYGPHKGCFYATPVFSTPIKEDVQLREENFEPITEG